jgi:DNA-directed RNA polymerase alpha subunit
MRVIDANLNRLREGLRVIEEYVRFIDTRPAIALQLKELRHQLVAVESLCGRANLLANRDTSTDPLSEGMNSNELERVSAEAVMVANFKRAQEAARVIEEYVKIVPNAAAAELAKALRFKLYSIEKEIAGSAS